MTNLFVSHENSGNYSPAPVHKLEFDYLTNAYFTNVVRQQKQQCSFVNTHFHKIPTSYRNYKNVIMTALARRPPLILTICYS